MDTEDFLEVLLKRIEALAIDNGKQEEVIDRMAEEIVMLKNDHKAEVSILKERIHKLESGEGDCFVLTTNKKEE